MRTLTIEPNGHPADTATARIGPNAVTQMASALENRLGAAGARELMKSAGLGAYIQAPPKKMIDEREVIALHTIIRDRLAPATASAVAHTAGLATGDYLLANRIPRAAQLVLRVLPAPLAARALLAAITRHSWTFAGSGHFHARAGRPVVITIQDCPICRGAHALKPLCDYYAATFTRLFTRLVHKHCRVRETACTASGAPACRFEIDWS